MKKYRWFLAGVLVLALVAGAHRIVSERNRALYPGGSPAASSAPMH
jgi:hypothetical protein